METIVNVSVPLLTSDVVALKRVTGKTTMKDAITYAVQHALGCKGMKPGA